MYILKVVLYSEKNIVAIKVLRNTKYTWSIGKEARGLLQIKLQTSLNLHLLKALNNVQLWPYKPVFFSECAWLKMTLFVYTNNFATFLHEKRIMSTRASPETHHGRKLVAIGLYFVLYTWQELFKHNISCQFSTLNRHKIFCCLSRSFVVWCSLNTRQITVDLNKYVNLKFRSLPIPHYFSHSH